MIGQTLGHYRIVEQVGAGGMGVVYRARDTRLDRDVALKLLPAGALSDEAARRRFRNEALALSKLSHPNIATVFDFDSQGGVDFLVMEYISGIILSEQLRAGALREKDVVALAAQIAAALEEAHEHGIVHCDLKPSNVAVTSKGRVKVFDFGLAQILHPSVDVEATEIAPDTDAAGTLPYMAPEVLRGKPPDARSDTWSLGVMLYEMLAGKPPFQAETGFALASRILRDAPAPLARHVPPELQLVVGRCLEKDPAKRYQRAADLLADLEHFPSELASGSASLPSRRSTRAITSLAVLPFENAAADPEAEYLSDGITESLINILAQLPKLHVMARSTVFRYKGQAIDPQAVGRELNVRAVLTGRVSQRGDTLSIATELVDVANGWQLWGEQYHRKRADLLAVQDAMAREIAGRLRLRLTGEEKKRLARRYTRNTDAYHCYLKGRYYWNKRTPEDLKRGIEFFNQAIEKDPHYTLAYAGLADSYYLLAGTAFAALAPGEAFPKAKAAALKALELDDSLAEAHTSLATILVNEWDWGGAAKEFERSIELNPGYATARHWYAFYLTALGRLDEAIREGQRAQELDPLSVIINRDLGLIYYYARKPDRAIEQYCKSLELDPNFALTHQALGRAYLLKGMREDALAALRLAAALSSDSVAMCAALAHALAETGSVVEARKILADLIERSRRSYVSPTNIAVVYAGLGENDEAMECLEKALAEHNAGLMMLKVHPVFDPLRSDPRYQDLLRRIGLAPWTLCATNKPSGL
jgi:eukaryotic-like serine/threonine-protein kinase